MGATPRGAACVWPSMYARNPRSEAGSASALASLGEGAKGVCCGLVFAWLGHAVAGALRVHPGAGRGCRHVDRQGTSRAGRR
eukprot:scaffold855_cov344-Prasinococcus_capsulatus_cf.AAC.18